MTLLAVVAGIGAGTGSAVAQKFALKYPVALLARSKENLDPVVDAIKRSGGHAKGYVTDVSNEEQMKTTFRQIEEDFPSCAIASGIYNVGGAFKRGSFLDVSLEDWTAAQKSNGFVSMTAFGEESS